MADKTILYKVTRETWFDKEAEAVAYASKIYKTIGDEEEINIFARICQHDENGYVDDFEDEYIGRLENFNGLVISNKNYKYLIEKYSWE